MQFLKILKMLLTNIYHNAILQVHSIFGGKKMIYDVLNKLYESEGVSTLSYEVLNCAR